MRFIAPPIALLSLTSMLETITQCSKFSGNASTHPTDLLFQIQSPDNDFADPLLFINPNDGTFMPMPQSENQPYQCSRSLVIGLCIWMELCHFGRCPY